MENLPANTSLLEHDSGDSDYGTATTDASILLAHDSLANGGDTDYSSHPVLKHYDRETLEATHDTKCYALGVPGFVLMCVFLTALSSVLLGYDIGVMAGAKIKIRKDFELSDRQVRGVTLHFAELSSCLRIGGLKWYWIGGTTGWNPQLCLCFWRALLRQTV
jgi:hypothetical protein